MILNLFLITPGTKPRPHWPQEQEEQLMALLDEGLSRAEIAKRMGITKNAISGKLSRLRNGHAFGSVGFERRVNELARIHANRPGVPAAPPWGKCQWPHGHVGKPEFSFCGSAALLGRPYCKEHDHISRGSVTPKALAVLLRRPGGDKA